MPTDVLDTLGATRLAPARSVSDAWLATCVDELTEAIEASKLIANQRQELDEAVWGHDIAAERRQTTADITVRDKLHAVVELADPKGRSLTTYDPVEEQGLQQLLATRQDIFAECRALLQELVISQERTTTSDPDDPEPTLYRFPPVLPQQTFMEVKAIMQAFADGPTLRHWSPVEGEVALRHKAGEDTVVETKINGNPMLDWIGFPLTQESLEAELHQAGIPATLLLNICVGAAIEQHQVTVTLDDLIAALGLDPRYHTEREALRQRVWRWLLLCDAAQVIGCRPGRYKGPGTGRAIDLQSRDALIKITGRRAAPQQAFDQSAPPIEVTFVAGPWVSQLRHRRDVLQYIGNIRRLAALPAGKVAGQWAQAIGLALNQLWRERAARGVNVKRVGEDNHLSAQYIQPFTRRELLTLFPPKPTVWEILEGPHPKRAQVYWQEAVTKFLRAQKHISYYNELEPIQIGRQDWADAWLDQPLDIRPVALITGEVVRIAKDAKAARSRIHRRGRPKATSTT